MMSQLLLHLLGDYVLQTDEMATGKTKSKRLAALHCLFYTCPFIVFLNISFTAAIFIFSTHFFIDHYRLARYVIILKNRFYTNRSHENLLKYTDKNLDTHGFPNGTPKYVGFMVMIVVDNSMHIACNAFAIAYL